MAAPQPPPSLPVPFPQPPLACLAALGTVLVVLGWLDPTRLPEGWDAWWPDSLSEWRPGSTTSRPAPDPAPAPASTPRETEPPPASRSANSPEGRLTHVRHGDTLEVAGVPVRIANIDCDELGTPEGESARLFLQDLVRGQRLTCNLEGRWSYDREVGTCMFTTSGEDLGEILIEEGICGRWNGRGVGEQFGASSAEPGRTRWPKRAGESACSFWLRPARLMGVFDAVNARWGRRLVPASTGLERAWATRFELGVLTYTTWLDELPKARV